MNAVEELLRVLGKSRIQARMDARDAGRWMVEALVHQTVDAPFKAEAGIRTEGREASLMLHTEGGQRFKVTIEEV